MSDIFHLCDSGVISGASFWLWITQTSLNICTRVWLFFINSYVCAYSSSPCSPCVWIVIHQSTWHVNHHTSVYVVHPHVHVISLLCFITNKSSVNVSLCSSQTNQVTTSQVSVSHGCVYSLSFTLLIVKYVLFSEVWFICFFRGDLHPRYCRGLSRGRRSVLLHCLQSVWLC